MKNSIYIVDDHKMLLHGLKSYLESKTRFKIDSLCTNSTQCMEKLKKTKMQGEEFLPEIIIIDVQLQEENGICLAEKIIKEFPSIKCVMYSMYDTVGYVLQAKNTGVKGYISKVSSEEELVRGLKKIQAGMEYFESKIESSLNKLCDYLSFLTKQEKIILEKLLQKKTNKEIASELFLSCHTIENYVSYIYDKFSVKNRNELEKLFLQTEN